MKNYIQKLFSTASDKLDYLRNKTINVTIPANTSFGDYSTNIAMILAKELRKKPLDIANEIMNNLQYDNAVIIKVETVNPGFINFFFNPEFLPLIVKQINESENNFGRDKKYLGQKAMVEFVSANPTGPLTVGHGRNAVIGDTIANMLEWLGYSVDREYYFNNAGRQMRILGDSVRFRYLELLGNKIDFPEDYYQGEYIKEIAQKLYQEFGDSIKEKMPEEIFKEKAESEIFLDIKNTLNRLGIVHDTFFNEDDLYKDGKIEELLTLFKEKNLSYEKDNAVWLRLTELGNDQDKVIVKSTGEPTYRLPDIAYHVNKFERKYDLIVDLFGSDHNATYPDVLAGVKSLGFDSSKIKVLIHQFVTIVDKGQVIKMSTRKANFITLDELIDEVGCDVVRYFFIMRSIGSHLNFDLTLAKTQSEENPVFYLQYAYARISSILRAIKEEKLELSHDNLNLLITDEEQLLIKNLYKYKEEIELAAENYEPHRISSYLEELAASFHRFYNKCRVLGSEKKLAEARIALITSVKNLLKNGLDILGISAPEKM